MSQVVRLGCEGGARRFTPLREAVEPALHRPTATAVPRSVNRRAGGAGRAFQDTASGFAHLAVHGEAGRTRWGTLRAQG